MAEALRQPRRFEPAVPVPGEVGGPRARGAYRILYLLFIIAPIAVGLDKFAHVLVNWDQYLAPVVDQMLPIHVSAHVFMLAVGVVEIVAGLLVAAKPSVGGWIVAVWLWGIIVNLLLIPGYYDIAVRDFGLSVGAVALARLARDFAR